MMNRFSSMYMVNYKCGYNDYDDMGLSDLTEGLHRRYYQNVHPYIIDVF